MKPKKAQKILKKLDVYLSMLEVQQPFLTPLNFQQRIDFREYAKALLIKENKKVSPNLEALPKHTINNIAKFWNEYFPTFTQPKEIAEKETSNYIIKTISFFIVDKKVSGSICYKNNNTCDIHIDRGVFDFRITIDDNFIIEKVFVTNDSLIRLMGEGVILSSKVWRQENNVLIIS